MASWDAQKKEGKFFPYFVTHRDQGPGRTLAKTAHILGLNESYVREIAGQWLWNDRADQWDAHLDQIARRAYVAELEKQARQRAQAFSALMGKGAEALKVIDLKKARLGEVAAAFKVSADGMRTEAGLATAKVEHEVTTLTEEQRLARLDELYATADRRALVVAGETREG